MNGSDPCGELRVALEALLLVRVGSSERSAVSTVMSRGKYSRTDAQGALRLVRTVLIRQDELERVVSHAVPEKISLRESSLASLAVLLALRMGGVHGAALNCLRVLSPDGFRRDLEYLVGVARTFAASENSAEWEGGKRVLEETYSPSWWASYCLRTFGRWRGLRLLREARRPRYLRVNSLRADDDHELPRGSDGLRDALEPVHSVPGVYRAIKPPPSLSRFLSDGMLQFQDLASYCAVLTAEPVAGESVLDLCAAPGAKTSGLAQLMDNSGKIVSVDYSFSRMKSWAREMRRLGVEIATPVIGDASDLGLTGRYELILLDPPCSGTGILDRNPEMKWRLTPESVLRYSQLQSMMLEESYRLLSPSGRILYSTCSLTLEENEQVVSAFLRMHSEMETVALPLSPDLGSAGMRGLGDCRRFYPYLDKTAGYFIARLEHV